MLLSLMASVAPQQPIMQVLDLGTGDGRVLATVLAAHPGACGVAMDAIADHGGRGPCRLRDARLRWRSSSRTSSNSLPRP